MAKHTKYVTRGNRKTLRFSKAALRRCPALARQHAAGTLGEKNVELVHEQLVACSVLGAHPTVLEELEKQADIIASCPDNGFEVEVLYPALAAWSDKLFSLDTEVLNQIFDSKEMKSALARTGKGRTPSKHKLKQAAPTGHEGAQAKVKRARKGADHQGSQQHAQAHQPQDDRLPRHHYDSDNEDNEEEGYQGGSQQVMDTESPEGQQDCLLDQEESDQHQPRIGGAAQVNPPIVAAERARPRQGAVYSGGVGTAPAQRQAQPTGVRDEATSFQPASAADGGPHHSTPSLSLQRPPVPPLAAVPLQELGQTGAVAAAAAAAVLPLVSGQIGLPPLEAGGPGPEQADAGGSQQAGGSGSQPNGAFGLHYVFKLPALPQSLAGHTARALEGLLGIMQTLAEEAARDKHTAKDLQASAAEQKLAMQKLAEKAATAEGLRVLADKELQTERQRANAAEEEAAKEKNIRVFYETTLREHREREQEATQRAIAAEQELAIVRVELAAAKAEHAA